MSLKPEPLVRVTVAGDWLACLHPDGAFQRVSRTDVQAIYFETGDGPFEMDWWIVEGSTPDTRCTFPLGATGEAEAVEWLKQLEGFEVLGMNSTTPHRFLCWRRDEARAGSV
jgi:hypothetical protein